MNTVNAMFSYQACARYKVKDPNSTDPRNQYLFLPHLSTNHAPVDFMVYTLQAAGIDFEIRVNESDAEVRKRISEGYDMDEALDCADSEILHDKLKNGPRKFASCNNMYIGHRLAIKRIIAGDWTTFSFAIIDALDKNYLDNLSARLKIVNIRSLYDLQIVQIVAMNAPRQLARDYIKRVFGQVPREKLPISILRMGMIYSLYPECVR